MKTLFFALILVISVGYTIASSKSASADRIPSKFERFDSSMVIHLYYGGGMHYSSENIYIRFDSCIRVDMDHGVDHVSQFAMTPEMRSNVLSILIKNNLEYIKHSEKETFMHDKATKSVCVESKGTKNFCVSDGSSREIAEEWKVSFSNVYSQLEEFSLTDGKMKK